MIELVCHQLAMTVWNSAYNYAKSSCIFNVFYCRASFLAYAVRVSVDVGDKPCFLTFDNYETYLLTVKLIIFPILV